LRLLLLIAALYITQNLVIAKPYSLKILRNLIFMYWQDSLNAVNASPMIPIKVFLNEDPDRHIVPLGTSCVIGLWLGSTLYKESLCPLRLGGAF
jgi:hypothetical protein